MSEELNIEEEFSRFFKQEKYRSLIANAAAQRKKSIMVDHSDLISFNEELSHLIVEEPLKYLPILDRAAYKQLQVEDPEYASKIKEFKARIFNLPEKVPIREIRSSHLRKLIAIDGIIVRASAIKPMLKTAVFRCRNCGTKYYVEQNSSKLRVPEKCTSIQCRGRRSRFELIEEESEYIDYQLIGVQEKPEDLPPGQLPRIIDVGLRGDIVDRARPGDRVIVTGILFAVQDRATEIPKKTSKMYLEAVSIETASKEPESLQITPEEERLFKEMARDPNIHQRLIESIAPSIYGLDHIKKAIMLLLFGGRPKQFPDGVKVRGDIHILLVGDPGTGKSQLLKYAAMIAPRGLYTSGRGSTAAGLCVSGDTLVYTDNGIVSIKEIVERNMRNGLLEIDDGVYVSREPKPIRILAPSKDLSEVEIHTAIQYYKLKAKEVVQIETILGKSITLTGETPILCSNDGKTLEWKKASQVKIGDHIAFIAKIPEVEGNWRKCLLEFIGDDVFVEISREKLEELLAKLSTKLGSLRNAAKLLNVDENYIYYLWRRGIASPKLRVLRKILEEAESSFEDIYPWIKSISYKSYRGRERVKLPPYPNEVFMEFLGDIYSDGCLIKDPRKKESYTIHYSTGSLEDARNYVERVKELFGLDPRIERDKRERCYVIRFSNKVIARLLIGFGVPVGDKGKDLEIHPIIHVMPRKLIGAFLKQLFTNDGGIVRGKCVFFSTSSKRLAEQVDLLLRRFGIISSIRERRSRTSIIGDKVVKSDRIYEISIYDLRSLKIFLKEIGFSNSKKLAELKELIKLRKGTHNNFKRLNDDIILVKVKNIVRKRVDEVYDLTINDSHAFIANGFIVHNTAAVVRDKGGGMVLEAGALVLADMGVACIDEIDKMRPEDRVAIHEAMAQQSYHRDFELLTYNYGKIKIGDLVDMLVRKNPDKVIKVDDCEILEIPSKLMLYTLDPKSMKVEVCIPIRVSRHKAPEKFIKISYSNGREIVVTPEHPIYVWRDGKIITVRADEIKIGEFVPSIRFLPNSNLPQRLKSVQVMDKREREIRLPLKLTKPLARLLGYLTSEGHFYAGRTYEVGFSNKDPSLINEVESLFAQLFGLKPTIGVNKYGVITLRYLSRMLYDFFKENFPEIVKTSLEKRVPRQILCGSADISKEFLRGLFLGDGSIDSYSATLKSSSKALIEDCQDLLLKLGISSSISRGKDGYYRLRISSHSLEKFVEEIIPKRSPLYDKGMKLLEKHNRANRSHDILPSDIGKTLRKLMKSLGLPYRGQFNEHLERNYGITRQTIEKEVGRIERRLQEILKGINEVRSIRELRSLMGYSQERLASLIGESRSTIDYAERGGYSTEKRERLLEKARRMVLKVVEEARDELDELEKLLNSDLSFIRVKGVEILENKGEMASEWVYDVTVEPTHSFISHGLLLHNTISIAKGGIVATLNARTSILAAANPALGRYDPYGSFTDNVNLPITILSRFDLIFVLRDEPEKERDRRIAEHIIGLQSRSTATAAPPIPPDVLRKYIAYAKRIKPELTPAAAKLVKDFYLQMRSIYQQTSTVAITARQLESLIRLAEARARAALRDYVTEEDVLDVIDLMKRSLSEVGVDVETGKPDIDVILTGKPKSMRDKFAIVIKTIKELQDEKGYAEDEEVRQALRERGLTDDEINKLLTRLLSDGKVFAPKPGRYRLT